MAADVHALSGAYALDALEPLERARFEAHLADCLPCRTEVAALHDTAAVLATLSAVYPLLALRHRLLSAIHLTPQLRPPTSGQQEPTHTSSRLGRLLAVAAAVVVLGATGAAVFDETERVHARVMARTVLDADDVQSRQVGLNEGAFTIATSRQLGLLAVVADMPELGPNRVYQLWVITDAARSLALLEDGQGFTAIPDRGRLAVTVEPTAGSPQPTTVPLFALDVSRFDAV